MTPHPQRKKPRIRVLLAIAIGGPLAVVGTLLVQDWITWSRRPVFVPPPPSHPTRLVVEPSRVDLGRRSQCEGLIRVQAVLRNASDQPAVLDDWMPSCGCSAPYGDFKRGMTIAPGEEIKFEVVSDGWVSPGEKNFHVNFTERFADAPARISIHYINESPLQTDVGYLTRNPEEPTTFRVLSRDKVPFKILGTDPPVATFKEIESADQEVTVQWLKVDEVLGPGWREVELLVKTDREDCPQISIRMQERYPGDWGEVVQERLSPTAPSAPTVPAVPTPSAPAAPQ